MAEPQIRVLIVEGTAEAAQSLGALLERSFGPHVTVQTYATGAEAYAFLRRYGADLLIVNAHLADGSGVALCQAVRNELDMTTLPILLVADAPTVADRLEQLASMADDCIARPMQERLLLARLELLWRTRGNGSVLRA